MPRGVPACLLGVATALALFGGVVVASAAPVYSYFPTASTIDGKMLVIAGVNLQTLSGTKATVSFSVANTVSQFNLGFFDGASNSAQWDMSSASFPTSYTLYADPLGDGTGNTKVAEWTDTQMAANAWSDFAVTTTPSAKSPSGNYFYRMTSSAINVNINQVNAFKVRVEGYTYIVPTNVFGFVGATAGNNNNPNYDGVWDFWMRAPQDMNHLDIWDGDLDVANDTDDPNTSATPPPFDTGWAVAEGAHPGNPLDDTNGNFLRTPNIRYDVVSSTGTTYTNANPSGNTEWELFRLDTTTSSPAVTDYQATQLRSGMYQVHITGMDLHNIDAMRFEYPLIGVDASGRPMVPPAPFLTTGTVFNDLNQDGTRTAGENGLAGVLLNLKDIVTGSIIAAASTDASGSYSFNTWNGTFDVVVDPSNYLLGGALYGMQPTSPNPQTRRITVFNTNTGNQDFGDYLPPPVILTVTPDQSGSIAPSSTIDYAFKITNYTATGGTFDLTTTSTARFADAIRTLGGSAVSSVTLAAGESTTVVVRISVPSTATIGTVDSMRLTARRRAAPGDFASAIAVTTVMDGLTLAPNHIGFASPGASIDYLHTVTNSWPTTRVVTLTATSTAGWTTQFYNVGGATPITTVTVGPFGAAYDFIARVTAPSAAASGAVGVTTVTASAAGATSTVTDSVVDTTTVRKLNTYETTSYVTPVDTFVRGTTVYARATGLTSGWTAYFVFKDSTGTTISVSADSSVNASGQAFASYRTVVGDSTGRWTVEVWRRNGGTLTIQSIAPFTVTADAEITRLSATDASSIGTSISVTSSTRNDAAAPLVNTSMTYTIWWDTNGDDVFNAGDTYINAAGAPVSYGGTSTVSTHVSSGIDVPGNAAWTDPAWTISNSQFPYQGNYKVTAVWKDSGGVVIDTATNEFYSIPAMGWPLFLLAFAGAVALVWRRTREGSVTP